MSVMSHSKYKECQHVAVLMCKVPSVPVRRPQIRRSHLILDLQSHEHNMIRQVNKSLISDEKCFFMDSLNKGVFPSSTWRRRRSHVNSSFSCTLHRATACEQLAQVFTLRSMYVSILLDLLALTWQTPSLLSDQQPAAVCTVSTSVIRPARALWEPCSCTPCACMHEIINKSIVM